MGQTPKPPLSETETTLLLILTHHVGQKRAISAALLAEAAEVSRRTVEKAIKALVEQHGVPIGSSPIHPGGGYWMIQTPEEMWRTRNSLLRRALSILTRVKAYDRTAWVEELLGQLALQVETEEAGHGEGQQSTAAAHDEHGTMGNHDAGSPA